MKIESILLIIPMIQEIMFDQNPSFGLRERVQTSFFFGQNLTLKCWCDHENEVKVSKI